MSRRVVAFAEHLVTEGPLSRMQQDTAELQEIGNRFAAPDLLQEAPGSNNGTVVYVIGWIHFLLGYANDMRESITARFGGLDQVPDQELADTFANVERILRMASEMVNETMVPVDNRLVFLQLFRDEMPFFENGITAVNRLLFPVADEGLGDHETE